MSKEILTLTAEKREKAGTRVSRRLRRTGRVPAIVYGHKQDPVTISVDHDELDALVRHHARMLDLALGEARERVLLSEVQHDTFGRDIIHADFIRVAMDEVITLSVPVVLHGRAVGEQHGGVTEQLMDEIEVECLPGDIPEEVTVVVTGLDVGDSVHVRDLQAPEKVRIVAEPSLLVVTIATPTKAAEAEQPEAEAVEEAAEPEVIAKGKAEEEEEEAPEEEGRPKKGQ